jgi:hypothetical protein
MGTYKSVALLLNQDDTDADLKDHVTEGSPLSAAVLNGHVAHRLPRHISNIDVKT